MDFRVKNLRSFPRAEDGLRAVVEKAPQAEVLAASWIESSRPVWTRVYALRRRIATVAVAVLACSLFVHVMLGANGMIVYRQKRAENQSLRKQVIQMQEENERYAQQIQGLKSDQKAIEKEAREQLGYARLGEVIYIAPVPAKPAPTVTHSASK
jgi:cell division protein FtsB